MFSKRFELHGGGNKCIDCPGAFSLHVVYERLLFPFLGQVQGGPTSYPITQEQYGSVQISSLDRSSELKDYRIFGIKTLQMKYTWEEFYNASSSFSDLNIVFCNRKIIIPGNFIISKTFFVSRDAQFLRSEDYLVCAKISSKIQFFDSLPFPFLGTYHIDFYGQAKNRVQI